MDVSFLDIWVLALVGKAQIVLKRFEVVKDKIEYL